MDDKPFHAAWIPKNFRNKEPNFNPESFISTTKEDIINLIKKYKGSRFKSFSMYDDALKFVICDNENGEPSATIQAEEPLPYPSLDIRDLNVFKRAIINRQLDAVKQLVMTNPRYLISNYFDSPTIIVQGARYNSVHLAIRNKDSEMLNFILDTVNSLEFVQKMNPNFGKESLIEKRDHILDLYLNSPDKACFDTPLHMACKFGDLDCVSILVSYLPFLDTQKRNKQNLLPYEVVKDSNLRKKIREMIDSSVFITVTKSNDKLDKSLNRTFKVGRKILESQLINDGSEVEISAIVGPMTPEKSEKVYEVFKSPKKCTPEQRLIRLRDPERGLERVVCELSKQYDLSYNEYWPFLKGFADFCTEADLRRLENYFQSKQLEIALSESLSKLTFENPGGDVFFDTNDNETDNEDEDIFYTAPSTPINEENNNNRMLVKQSFFINGTKFESIDHQVYETIQMAIRKKFLSKDLLENNYPCLNQWIKNVEETIDNKFNKNN